MSDMETDRPLEIGNLRKFGAWSAKFPQIANRPCSVCHRDMALTDANPAFGPAEQGIMLEMSEIDRFGSIWIDSDTLEIFGFLTRIRRDFSSDPT